MRQQRWASVATAPDQAIAEMWAEMLQPHPFRLQTRQDRPVSDRKTPDPNRFVTTALEFDLPNGCPALTLVVADTPGDAAPIVNQEGDGWRIEHGGGKVQVSWSKETLTLASDRGEGVTLRPSV
jgi:hypothetical protein